MNISKEELEKHKSRESCWIVLDNKVYDVTSFVGSHPGGRHVFWDNAGQDLTTDYNIMRHSDEADEMREELYVGVYTG